jgi:predicted DNA-binding protein (UPF0278 family)
MSDMARDAAVFEEWVEGSKVREIAAKYKIGVDVVLQALDRFVPVIDDAMRRRLVGREILRLEELYRCYFRKGTTDMAAAQLCLQLSRRFAELVGLDSAQKLDIRQVTSMPQESSTDRIMAALARLKHDPRYGGDGHASDDDGPSPPVA